MTDFDALRINMVDCQVRPSDVTKFPIIDAMLTIRREAFVPQSMRDVAYAGDHIPLGDGRMVMDPRVLAKMLDALDICPADLVLELGCGLGYSAAVIAHMAEAVIAVEQDEALAEEAESNLSSQSVDNAMVIKAELIDGAAKHGPYDIIMINGGVEQVPDAILNQLKEGGRLGAIFVPAGQFSGAGQFCVGTKTANGIAWRKVFDANVPVLPGFEKAVEFSL